IVVDRKLLGPRFLQMRPRIGQDGWIIDIFALGCLRVPRLMQLLVISDANIFLGELGVELRHVFVVDHVACAIEGRNLYPHCRASILEIIISGSSGSLSISSCGRSHHWLFSRAAMTSLVNLNFCTFAGTPNTMT